VRLADRHAGIGPNAEWFHGLRRQAILRPMPTSSPHVRPRLRLAAAIALAAAAALGSAPAAAAGDAANGLAQLRQVFADGRQFEDKGHWAEALEKFKEVAAVKMTPQVRFHIALCEENLGKLVSAIRGFDLAGAEATAAGSSAVEVPSAAKQHAEALRARIAKLRVDVSGKLTTSKILLDDTALGEKEVGTDIEVDPGAHVVEVRDAAGKSTFRKELTLAEKVTEKLEVVVDDKEDAPTPPPIVPITAAPSRIPAYVTGAVGIGALIGSGVFFGLRASNIATVNSHCTDPVNHTGCSAGDQNLASQGKAFTGAADGLLAVGLVGVAAGTVLYFVLAPKKQTAAAPPAATLRIAPGGTSVRLLGTF
jgi:hypothetical protein